VATAAPVEPELLSAEPNHNSNSFAPATVRPVAEGLVEGTPEFHAPMTSIEHGPAIVACVISAAALLLTATVNVLLSVPSAVR
jgi:hypothetical protein